MRVMDKGFTLVSVAVPPLIARSKSVISKNPFPELVLNTCSSIFKITLALSRAICEETMIGFWLSSVSVSKI